VLAQFTSKAYIDFKRGETAAQYGARLALPDTWKLLTTSSNITKDKGCFWAAYWHPEHQQFLIVYWAQSLQS